MELFENEFDYREVTNWQELTNLAVALFIGMTGGPATTPSGGGGSSTENNWAAKKTKTTFTGLVVVPKPPHRNWASSPNQDYADKLKNPSHHL